MIDKSVQRRLDYQQRQIDSLTAERDEARKEIDQIKVATSGLVGGKGRELDKSKSGGHMLRYLIVANVVVILSLLTLVVLRGCDFPVFCQ